MMIRVMIFLFMFHILFISCNSTKKRLSNEELIEIVKEEGNRITAITQQVLGSKLKSTINEQGIPQALKYCNLQAYPLIDSLEEKMDVEVKRASIKTRNPQDSPDRNELKIINNYLSDIKKSQTPEVYVSIQQNEIHFAKPIILNDQLCLNCHGQVGKDITDENYHVIKALYPEDNATGHQLGDLRGIWSLKFNRDYFEKRAIEMSVEKNNSTKI